MHERLDLAGPITTWQYLKLILSMYSQAPTLEYLANITSSVLHFDTEAKRY